MFDWKKYLITFFITGSIFTTAIIVSNYFNNKRVIHIKEIQESISTDILSSETQFSLLSELSCKEVGGSILSRELDQLGKKIEYSEENLGLDNEEILQLKKFYSLLEIKDYLLMKRINDRCGKNIMFAFYFYSEEKKCPECLKMGYALSGLRELYPDLRVYSFDYSLDVSAIRTLITIFDVKDKLPAVIIGDDVHYGSYERDQLEKLLRAAYPKQVALIEAKRKEEDEKTKKEAPQTTPIPKKS